MYRYSYHGQCNEMELRRRVNQNLNRIANGFYRREREAETAKRRADAKYRYDLRQEKRELKLEIKSMRKVLDSTEEYYDNLANQHNAGTISHIDYAAYEELDADRNRIYEMINESQDRIYQIEESL